MNSRNLNLGPTTTIIHDRTNIAINAVECRWCSNYSLPTPGFNWGAKICSPLQVIYHFKSSLSWFFQPWYVNAHMHLNFCMFSEQYMLCRLSTVYYLLFFLRLYPFLSLCIYFLMLTFPQFFISMQCWACNWLKHAFHGIFHTLYEKHESGTTKFLFRKAYWYSF